MAQFDPNNIYPGSPIELILFLDSVINSSLCPHTKDWVCFLYVDLHTELSQLLRFSIHPNMENNLFMAQYGGSEGRVPFRIHDLVTYVEDVPWLPYQVVRLAQAQSVKRAFSGEWDIVAHNLVWRIPLPIRLETPNTGPRETQERCNPAVWFALQGQYTIENFLASRSMGLFIEDHWRRLSFQFDSARTGKWVYHDAVDRCRCPGYELPHLLACTEPNRAADAVLKQILGHIDPLIFNQLQPALESYEEERRRASIPSLQNWYQPQGSKVAWTHVARVPALEAVANRLLIAFERLSNDAHFRSMAEARVAAKQASQMWAI